MLSFIGHGHRSTVSSFTQESVDLSFLQILWSSRRVMVRIGVDVFFGGAVQGVASELMSSSMILRSCCRCRIRVDVFFDDLAELLKVLAASDQPCICFSAKPE